MQTLIDRDGIWAMGDINELTHDELVVRIADLDKWIPAIIEDIEKYNALPDDAPVKKYGQGRFLPSWTSKVEKFTAMRDEMIARL